MAKQIVSIPHKFWLAGVISFRKDYSPPPLVRHLDPTLVSLVLGNILDLGSHALQEGSHANLPVGIVLAGKHRDLPKTIHGRQVVFEPVKELKTSTKL